MADKTYLMWKEVTQVQVPSGVYTCIANLLYYGYDQNYSTAFFSVYLSAGLHLVLQLWAFKPFEIDYGYKSATYYAKYGPPTA